MDTVGRNRYNITKGCHGKVGSRKGVSISLMVESYKDVSVEHCFNNTKDWRCKYTYKDGILPDVPGSKAPVSLVE